MMKAEFPSITDKFVRREALEILDAGGVVVGLDCDS